MSTEEQKISFDSDGLALSGLLAVPDGGGRKPAIVVMHGFGGHKDGPQQRWSRAFYNALGYATLRFDFRGCGESEGPRGWVIPDWQVADARNALTYLAAHPEIDPDRIALSGTSYGGTVAVGAAGVDSRVAAVIAQGGWGNGEKMFRRLHASDAAWQRFSALLEAGRRHKAASDTPMTVHRFDLIPVPEYLRENIDKRSIFDFPIETGLTTFDYNAEDAATKIAPRPLLLIHSAKDDVIHPAGSVDLFLHAGQPTDLHILSGVDHFMFGEDDSRVAGIMRDWLARYLPVG